MIVRYVNENRRFQVDAKSKLNARTVDGVPEVTPDEFKKYLGQLTLIDVRRPDEFVGELSHIPGARLVTLGPALDDFLKGHDNEDEIVFVCRSGARSGQATRQSREMGFTRSVNLKGGMLLWNQNRYPIEGKL